MIAGWVTIDDAPALVVLETLDAPCTVALMLFARDRWRTILSMDVDPARPSNRVGTRLEHDYAFSGDALVSLVLATLVEWRADAGTGLARWAP